RPEGGPRPQRQLGHHGRPSPTGSGHPRADRLGHHRRSEAHPSPRRVAPGHPRGRDRRHGGRDGHDARRLRLQAGGNRLARQGQGRHSGHRPAAALRRSLRGGGDRAAGGPFRPPWWRGRRRAMETMTVLLPIVAFVAAVGLVLSIYGTATTNRNRLADRLAGYTQSTGSSLALGNAGSTVLKEHTYSGIPIIQ